jgi:hypothetical protein
METGQIIIMSIIALAAMFFYFKVANSLNEKKNSMLYFLAYSFIISILFTILLITTKEMNYYKKLSKGRCPEYKQIDTNTYQKVSP